MDIINTLKETQRILPESAFKDSSFYNDQLTNISLNCFDKILVYETNTDKVNGTKTIRLFADDFENAILLIKTDNADEVEKKANEIVAINKTFKNNISFNSFELSQSDDDKLKGIFSAMLIFNF